MDHLSAFSTNPPEKLLLTERGAITIGIDVHDADGDAVTVTAVSSTPGIQIFIPSGNRQARMNFVRDDGSPIGPVLVEIFETRGGMAAERFIDLATNQFNTDGSAIAGADPFFNDVFVHRIANLPDFIIQAGAFFGGTEVEHFRNSNLPNFADEFELQQELSFAGPGVLAMANTGQPVSNASQFFLTDGPTPHLNGNHMIFGQVISGQEVITEIAGFEVIDADNPIPSLRDLRPVNPPRITSVDIVSNNQDATITLKSTGGFVGTAQVTLVLEDTTNSVTQKTIALTVLGIDQADVSIRPGTSVSVTPTAIGDAGENQIIVVSQASSDPQLTFDSNTNRLDIDIPAGTQSQFKPVDLVTVQLDHPIVSATHTMFAIVQEYDEPPVTNRLRTSPLGAARSVVTKGDFLYVANVARGIEIFDITATPQFVGGFDSIGNSRNIAVHSYTNPNRDVAFVADDTGGVLILDVSNPANVSEITRMPVDSADPEAVPASAFDVLIEDAGNAVFLYVAADTAGLVAYNATNPENIGAALDSLSLVSGTVPLEFRKLAMKDDRILATLANSANLVSIDISKPINFGGSSFTATQLTTVAWGIHAAGDLLYLTEFSTGSRLSIFNITTASAPIAVGALDLGSTPWQVVANTDFAVVGHFDGGFSIVDVSNPATPETRHFLSAPAPGGRPLIRGTDFYLPVGNDGVVIVDGHQLTEPEITVLQDDVVLESGAVDAQAFPAATEGATGPTLSFTVENVGAVPLTPAQVTDTLSITQQVPDSLASGQETTFTVALKTDTVGTLTGQISIDSNDADESPFAINVTGVVTGTSSIAGQVWSDNNGDGINSNGEAGMPDITVFLDTSDNGQFDAGVDPATMTDSTGHYVFSDLASGIYTVRQLGPDTHIRTFPSPTDSHTIATAVGEAVVDVDFGNQPLPSTIRGRTWADTDGDGILEAGEAGLAGMVVYIDTNSNAVLNAGEPRRVTTLDNADTGDDESGCFAFVDVEAGSHQIRHVLPPGLTPSFPVAAAFYAIDLAPNVVLNDVDFGFAGTPSAISGMVWEDTDENNMRETDEPLVDDVVLTLHRNDDDPAFNPDDDDEIGTISPTAGSFSIAPVAAGDYWLVIDQVELSRIGYETLSGMYEIPVDVAANTDTPANIRLKALPSQSDSLALASGWNFVSLPFEPVDPAPTAVFTVPDGGSGRLVAVGSVWSYNRDTDPNQLSPANALVGLRGYWVFAMNPETVPITGSAVSTNTRCLLPDWNAVGPETTISAPAGSHLTSPFWGWSDGRFFATSNLRRTKGYLVKSDSSDCIDLGD